MALAAVVISRSAAVMRCTRRRMIKAQRTEVDPLPCRLGLGTRDGQVLAYPPQQYPDPGHP